MAFEGSIVVGLDGGERSARACSWAASVASASNQPLVVVHAYQVGDHVGGPDAAASTSLEQLSTWLSVTDLGPLAEEHVHPIAVSGHPGPALVEVAAAEHASLLVMGAPHVGAIAPHGLGRTVQHITHRSPIPIAIVRSPGGPVATAPLIVGLDPADCNLAAVEWSLGIAGRLGAPLEVLAVSNRQADGEAVERLLEQSVGPDSPLVDLFQVDGDPAEELMGRAEEIDASVIVVGQKRRHNIGGRVLGHVPSKLLYQSSRPVILLPHT